jgi:hypothetical protein
MLVPKAVDGAAATDIRASAATSGAQAATGASHVEVKKIIAQTAESRAKTDRILTGPSLKRASPG